MLNVLSIKVYLTSTQIDYNAVIIVFNVQILLLQNQIQILGLIFSIFAILKSLEKLYWSFHTLISSVVKKKKKMRNVIRTSHEQRRRMSLVASSGVRPPAPAVGSELMGRRHSLQGATALDDPLQNLGGSRRGSNTYVATTTLSKLNLRRLSEIRMKNTSKFHFKRITNDIKTWKVAVIVLILFLTIIFVIIYSAYRFIWGNGFKPSTFLFELIKFSPRVNHMRWSRYDLCPSLWTKSMCSKKSQIPSPKRRQPEGIFQSFVNVPMLPWCLFFRMFKHNFKSINCLSFYRKEAEKNKAHVKPLRYFSISKNRLTLSLEFSGDHLSSVFN